MRWGSMTSEILIIEWGGGPRKSGRRSIEIANPYVKETEFMDVTFQKFGLQLCTNPYYNLLAPFSHGAFLAWEFCQLLLRKNHPQRANWPGQGCESHHSCRIAKTARSTTVVNLLIVGILFLVSIEKLDDRRRTWHNAFTLLKWSISCYND